jgi:hypothetical protein
MVLPGQQPVTVHYPVSGNEIGMGVALVHAHPTILAAPGDPR